MSLLLTVRVHVRIVSVGRTAQPASQAHDVLRLSRRDYAALGAAALATQGGRT